MNKVLQGVVALIALGVGASALAADLPPAPVYKTPVMTPALYDWSGLYIGLNAGGGFSHNCWDINNDIRTAVGPLVPAVREGCNDASGALAGGQMGFRWQSGGWVFGVEGQGDWANFKSTNISAFYGAGVTNQTRADALGLLTGQVGWAWDSVLFYVKGGGAVVDNRYDGHVTATNLIFDGARETRWGGTVGAGIEFAFAPSWSIAAEYDHLFMGNRTLSFTIPGTPIATRTDRISQDADIGTIRVNYRWGGPVIAKY